jgi:hypothetical protein
MITMTMLTTPAAARRCMKARKASRLTCGHYVLRGCFIIRLENLSWVCVECATATWETTR